MSVQDILKQASDGLLFMSESDYPFEVIFWENLNKEALTPQKVVQRTAHPLDTPVEVVDLDSFFETAITEQDWHSLQEKETVKKYQALVETLKSNLSNLKVYRLGQRNFDVYIIGQAPSGHLAGLSTKVVET